MMSPLPTCAMTTAAGLALEHLAQQHVAVALARLGLLALGHVRARDGKAAELRRVDRNQIGVAVGVP